MLKIIEKITEWLLLGNAACLLGFLSDLFFFGQAKTEKAYTTTTIIMTICFGPISFLVLFISWCRLWKGRNDL